MEKINIKINDLNITAVNGQTILEVARENGIFIPTLCNDERVKPFGSCLLCRVEVEGARGNMLACATPVTDGMVVVTESESINKARKMCLELLVSQHYGDCVAPCSLTCPANIDVQGYIAHIANGDYTEAVKLIKEKNPLPLVCGRVCTRPCEDECRRNLVDERVGIDYLKRYASEFDLNNEKPYVPEKMPMTGKKAAIIGAGPAGLSCANYLALLGHEVTVFEKWPTAGGMLRYGIPEYRLPREPLAKEIDLIRELGVEIKFNTVFGKDFTYEDLKNQGYDAIFLGVGSQSGQPLGLENDNAEGVMTGVEFLGKVNAGEKLDFSGKRIIVIGGGNTALDASRTSTRLNAEDVILAYRRTKAEMPAHEIEIEEAEFEGVRLELLAAPKRLVVENNNVVGLEFIKMQLGEPDASGRRRPEEVPGSEYVIPADVVIAAIGQTQDLSFINDRFAISTNRNRIIADPEVMTTSMDGVFAGGDAVTGPDAAISAIAAGRRAAISMNLYMLGKEVRKPEGLYNHVKGSLKQINPEELKDFEKIKKQRMPLLSKEQRKNNFAEVELGFTEEMAKEEAKRCLSCGCKDVNECKLREYTTKYEVQQERFHSKFNVLPIDESHKYISKDQNKCITCGLCVRICSEQQGAGVWGFHQRGYQTVIAASFDMPFGEDSRCENCGQCVSVCPVGALTEKTNLPKPGPFGEQAVESICGGCSTGCSVILNTAGNRIVRVTSKTGVGINQGNLCERGRFSYDIDSLKNHYTSPMIRRNGVMETVTLEEAARYVMDKLTEVRDNIGADKIGVFASPELTNEQLQDIKSFATSVLNTKAIGGSCLSKASIHFADKIGSPIGSASYDSIADADYILSVGFDIKETNPVAALLIKNAVQSDKQKSFVVISKEKTQSGKFATKEIICEAETLAEGLVDHKIVQEFKTAKSPLLIMNDDADEKLVGKAVELLKDTEHGVESLLIMHHHCNTRGLIDAGMNVSVQKGRKASVVFGANKTNSNDLHIESEFTVVVSTVPNVGIEADVFIPMTGIAQSNGSFTNSAGMKGIVNAALPVIHDTDLTSIISYLEKAFVK